MRRLPTCPSCSSDEAFVGPGCFGDPFRCVGPCRFAAPGRHICPRPFCDLCCFVDPCPDAGPCRIVSRPLAPLSVLVAIQALSGAFGQPLPRMNSGICMTRPSRSTQAIVVWAVANSLPSPARFSSYSWSILAWPIFVIRVVSVSTSS